MVSFTLRPFYPPERAPGTHGIGGWMGPRIGLDYVDERKFLILPGLELLLLCHSARTTIYQTAMPTIICFKYDAICVSREKAQF
jgi:hypothetical protein